MRMFLQILCKAVIQNSSLLGVVPFFSSYVSELTVRNLIDVFGILVRNMFLGW